MGSPFSFVDGLVFLEDFKSQLWEPFIYKFLSLSWWSFHNFFLSQRNNLKKWGHWTKGEYGIRIFLPFFGCVYWLQLRKNIFIPIYVILYNTVGDDVYRAVSLSKDKNLNTDFDNLRKKYSCSTQRKPSQISSKNKKQSRWQLCVDKEIEQSKYNYHYVGSS